MPGTASLIELYDDDRDGRTFELTRRPPGQPRPDRASLSA